MSESCSTNWPLCVLVMSTNTTTAVCTSSALGARARGPLIEEMSQWCALTTFHSKHTVEEERVNKSSVEYTSVSGVEVSSVSSASEENLSSNGLSKGDENPRGQVKCE